jgi:hypothetical protein
VNETQTTEQPAAFASEVGPAYAAQRVGQKTVILHLLKDFKDADMLQKGIDVVVKRESGRSLASLNTRGAESEKGSSMEC